VVAVVVMNTFIRQTAEGQTEQTIYTEVKYTKIWPSQQSATASESRFLPTPPADDEQSHKIANKWNMGYES